jgi:curved DNA-binding protein CbpA
MNAKDYYKILQVDCEADSDVIAAAYKRLAMKFHPDTSKLPDSREKMQEINEAYAILGNSMRREEYDKRRRRTIETNYIVIDNQNKRDNIKESAKQSERTEEENAKKYRYEQHRPTYQSKQKPLNSTKTRKSHGWNDVSKPFKITFFITLIPVVLAWIYIILNWMMNLFL